MSGRWRVTVDQDRCAGAGLCAGLAPHRFTLAGGRSQPPAGPVDADDVVLDAAECCPMEAIILTDAATGEPIFAVPAEEG
jgi:ferredoxin